MQKVGYKVGYKKPINLDCFKKIDLFLRSIRFSVFSGRAMGYLEVFDISFRVNRGYFS